MLRTSDLDYELPPERIGTHPAEPRDAARLMVVSRDGGHPPVHAHVRDLPSSLRPGDLLVRNTTMVLPARFLGRNEHTGAKVQGLYLAPFASSDPGRHWQALLKMRRFREGTPVRLLDRRGEPSDVVLFLGRRASEGGEAGAAGTEDEAGWIVRVESPDAPTAGDQQILERVGLAPLPPYILAQRKREEDAGTPHPSDETAHDLAVYQTVFADRSRAASVAAPTAGLHFTPQLLDALRARSVRIADVVLHVGMGTFKPVETEFVEQHPMHAEWCTLPAATARAILDARHEGGRVIAVGTTSARTLESFPGLEALAASTTPGTMATRILITPGHRFRNLDGLMTNFHLPRSTLLAMVGALLGDDGVPRLLDHYREAIREGYRFYSFGDAMLVEGGES